jgi:hypothetical protein
MTIEVEVQAHDDNAMVENSTNCQQRLIRIQILLVQDLVGKVQIQDMLLEKKHVV